MLAPKRWNETCTKNAKVIVPAVSSPPAIAEAPHRLTLELQPETDLSAGKLVGLQAVRVLRDGQPLAGLSVALDSEAGGTPQRQRSDAQGRVVFAASAPGRWMLSGTELRSLNAAQGTWESQFTTLVFELLPHDHKRLFAAERAGPSADVRKIPIPHKFAHHRAV